jgi:Sap-like sulfolipid-1-addressing protein
VWFELLFLALASAFWPLLLAVAVAALASERPVVVLGFFILGGMLTCVVEGVVIVWLLRRGHAISSTDQSLDPVVYYVGAVLSFLMAAVVQRMPAIRWRPKRHHRQSSIPGRMRGAGPVTAFSAGVIVNILPGIFPLIALKDIAELDIGLAGVVLVITVYYAIMFLLVEVPFVAYLFAPRRTGELVDASLSWIGGNKRIVAVYVLLTVGSYLFLRGIVTSV